MASPLVEVQLELDSKGFDQGLKKAANSAKSAGDKAASNFNKSFNVDLFGSLKSKILGLGAAIGAGLTFDKAISSAIAQQNAINDLNRSLAASGQYTKEASLGFQEYATSLQNASIFGDEVILKNAALIQSLGKLDQQGLKRATQAALDLSSALNIDLASASTLVGKAAAGEVGSFSRYGLVIKKGKDNVETFTNALLQLEGRFGGASAAKLNTFEGQLKRTANAFDDILEGIGGILTNSPTLLALIKIVGEKFVSLANSAAKLGSRDLFSIDGIVAFGTAINDFIIAPIELLYNIGKVVFGYINTTAAAAIGAFGQVGLGVAKLLDAMNVKPELSQNLKDFAETSLQVFDENQAALAESVDKVFEGTIYGKGDQFLSNLSTNLANAKAEIEASGIKNVIQPEVQTEGPSFASSFTEGFAQAEITLKNFAEKTRAFGAQIRANLQSGIANGAGQAFAAFGQALAKGENALSAFAKSFISSIGQIAIQQGTAFILQGIAYQFVPGFQGVGSGLIAAGAALATFGGVLSAFSGGGGAGGSSGAGSSGSFGTETGLATPQERLEPQTTVAVNIQGNVFDSEETGLRISNILKEASLNNNVKASVFT